MRKFYLKRGSLIATFALAIASNTVNAVCSHIFYQPKVPQAARKLRKF
ncbi:cyclic lactone autoinducer peptide [Lacrimispora brassicae]